MQIRLWLSRLRGKLRKVRWSPARSIAVIFAVIILVGTMLLSLPIASRSGVSCGVRPALFTVTSATCVTGLVLYDTWTQWSGFGQIVILCLMEIGGLGFMTAASFVIFTLRRKIGLKQKMLMAQALSVQDMESVVKLQKWVLVGSLIIQATGMLVLFLRLFPSYGVGQAFRWSVFHAVSAFCNAGFDIMGSVTPGQSMAYFHSDPVVLITLMGLIVVGGLGFFVWEEVARVHNWKKFSAYTKLVLTVTGVLILFGGICICLLEWNNPATLGAMSTGDKILNGVFQSVTARTAGFATFSQAGLTDAGKAVTAVLMLIGGSSGSTAGGIKTVTMFVLFMFLWTQIRGKRSVSVFKRTLPQQQVLDAMTVASVLIGLAVFGGVFLCVTSPVGLTDAIFEAASALATVGLSADVTAKLSVASQFLLILYMYFGRVGVLTLSLSFLSGNKAEERFRYAQTNFLIG